MEIPVQTEEVSGWQIRLASQRRDVERNCSGEMLRYHEELRLRRQPAKLQLTLRLESVGIKQD